MTTPQINIFDAVTGKTIIRDMNAAELAQYETDKIQAEKDAKATAKAEQVLAAKRQIILDRLGITEDELETILT